MSRCRSAPHRDELRPAGSSHPSARVVRLRPRSAVTTQPALLVAAGREQDLRVSQAPRFTGAGDGGAATDRSTATDDVFDHPGGPPGPAIVAWPARRRA